MMMNKFGEMNEAVEEAKIVLRAADGVTDKMAQIIVGRLRHVNSYWGENALCSLKRELANWNMTTRKWKP